MEDLREAVQDKKKWLTLVEEKTQYSTDKCEVNSGEANGKPLLHS
jgi:hypothetical protein